MTSSDLTQRQEELEEEQLWYGIKRYQDNLERMRNGETEADTEPGMMLVRESMSSMITAIHDWITATYDGKAGRRHVAVAMIEDMEEEVVALLAIRTAIHSISQRKKLSTVAHAVAESIRDEKEYRAMEEEAPGLYKTMQESLKTSTSPRHKRKVMRRMMDKAETSQLEWQPQDKLKLGTALLQLAEEATGLVSIQKYSVGNGQTSHYIEATQETLDWLQQAHEHCQMLSPMYFPMVAPPIPWEGPYGGGYYTGRFKLKLVKTRNKAYLDELNQADMDGVYEAINAIQETRWAVNRPVYDVMAAAWDQDLEIGGLPPREALPLPPMPPHIKAETSEDWQRVKEEYPEDVKDWKRRAAEVHEQNARLVSRIAATGQQLWMAYRFSEEEAIYFPHVMDFRGRAYPVPSPLNPQADDTGRALLTFADCKPLGDEGVEWLAVHLANCWGEDKISLEARIQWANDHTDEIMESAMWPLEGTQWWTQADEPWQFLAACMEWLGYQLEGPTYCSRLPIHMDGSCNGLQNFSAMLRDEKGGAATNLVPQEEPADIYQEVGDQTTRLVKADVDKGEELAKDWWGNITRKIVKRPVMTTPYGVTQRGIQDQIRDELQKAKDAGQYPLSYSPAQAAAYLGKKVSAAVGQVVVASHDAMAWLQAVAKVTAQEGLPLHWTTPMGMPILQDYHKQKSKRIDCRTQGRFRLQLNTKEELSEIDKARQRSGIAPNFVHSLDAAHMQATVVRCRRAGIHSFAMVHDSYGTHAADAMEMGIILREAFVAQYSDDVLLEFRRELEDQVEDDLAEQLPELPQTGDLDLGDVLESDFFFA